MNIFLDAPWSKFYVKIFVDALWPIQYLIFFCETGVLICFLPFSDILRVILEPSLGTVELPLDVSERRKVKIKFTCCSELPLF
jgi:hypothetical protein